MQSEPIIRCISCKKVKPTPGQSQCVKCRRLSNQKYRYKRKEKLNQEKSAMELLRELNKSISDFLDAKT